MPASKARPKTDPVARLAVAQASFDEALAGHDAATERLDEAKQVCFTECEAAIAATWAAREGLQESEVKAAAEKARAGDDTHPLSAAILAEELAHENHREELEDAYGEFALLGAAEDRLNRAKRGLAAGPTSHPAKDGVNPISADLLVSSDLTGR